MTYTPACLDNVCTYDMMASYQQPLILPCSNTPFTPSLPGGMTRGLVTAG
jgi:hypothetical protein